MIPIGTVDGILEYLKDCERTARRFHRTTLAKFGVSSAGTIAAMVMTARAIERGAPWWLITLDFLIVAACAYAVVVFTRRLRDARRFHAEIVQARERLYGSRLFDVWLTGPTPSKTSD